MKKFKVKPEYVTASDIIIGREVGSHTFHTESAVYRKLKECNVLDVFCEEVIPVIEPWTEPKFYLNSFATFLDGKDKLTIDIYVKAYLMIRMQCWADYYNKMDNFVAEWNYTTTQRKYGIEIISEYDGIRGAIISIWKNSNRHLFQISVGSEQRAIEMLKYFRDDIDTLINDKLL